MKTLILTAIASTVILVAPCLASNFVMFEGVEGGSAVAGREGWSDLKSYKGGTRKKSDGTIEAKETKIKICADKSSAVLAAKHLTGEVIPTVTLEFEKPDPDSGVDAVYLRIRLCNVTITEIDTEFDKDETDPVEESYCVEFEQIKITNPKDGTETVIDVTGDPSTAG